MAVTSPVEETPRLTWCEDTYPALTLNSLHTLQKGAQFCDVSLIVEDHEISAHRAILAVCSPVLFDMFSMAEDSDPYRRQFKIKDVDYTSFMHIINFAYTARLDISASEVKDVYKAAYKLEVSPVAYACSQYLAQHLTPGNCLATRMFAVDDTLKDKSNLYIGEHMSEVMSENHIKGLPKLQVEIIGADVALLTLPESSGTESELFRLVLCWLKAQYSNLTAYTLDDVSTHVHILYLNPDNTLTDCNQLDEKNDLSCSDMIKDYKSISRKQINSSLRSSRESLNLDVQSAEIGANTRSRRSSPQTVGGAEWSIVARQIADDNSCVALAIINGIMSILSLHLTTAPPTSAQSEAGSDVGSEFNDLFSDRLASLSVLAPMSSARCAAGVAALDGKLIVCGGYDRGECLETVESYNPETNEWQSLASMNTKRARIDVANCKGKLYACGGSDGTKDLKTVECYDTETNKWIYISDISTPVCHASLVSLKGRLILVGGSTGVASSDSCQMYDPHKDVWSPIANLNMRRSQSAICEFAGTVFAIGGSDSWGGITSTVEIYDLDTDNWNTVAPLNMPRRGAVAVTCNGKLYVIGGTDGNYSLSSTEIYDPDKNSWIFGPSMNVARANVGAVTIGDKIFACGGFNGKYFLDSIERFDCDLNEWTVYKPPRDVVSSDVEADSKINGDNVYDSADDIGYTKTQNAIRKNDLSHINGDTSDSINQITNGGNVGKKTKSKKSQKNDKSSHEGEVSVNCTNTQT